MATTTESPANEGSEVGTLSCPQTDAVDGFVGMTVQTKTVKSVAASSAKPRRRLATIGLAAEYVDMHPRTVRRWIAAGRLPAYRVGPRLLKIDLNELEDMLRRIPVWQPPAR